MKFDKSCMTHMNENCVIGAMSNEDFHAEIMRTMYEDMSDDECFHWLYALTMIVYDIKPTDNPCSKGKVKRWRNLADIWGRCAETRAEPNLFMLALHKIRWGIHPNNFPKEIPVEMVDTVEKALIRDSECFKGWKINDYYCDAFDNIVYQYLPIGKSVPRQRSDWYLKYTRNHTWLHVVYKCEAPPTIDLANYTRAEFVSAQKHATIYAEYHSYKMVISKLIPDASSWNEVQWLDERLLYRKIQKLYGVSMRDFSKELDRVISFLVELWYYKTTSIVRLLLIKNIPDALMEAIWPQNTQREVTTLLCLAYSRVKSAHTYLGKYDRKVYSCSWEKLCESWIYNRCKEWVCNGELADAAPRTRKIVFEIESGIAA